MAGNDLTTSAETKVCSKCGKEKLTKEFYSDSQSRDGLRGCCIVCFKAQGKVYRAQPHIKRRHLEVGYAWKRQHRRRIAASTREHKYGLTLSRMIQLYTEQEGRCPVCGGDLSLDGFATDHDHNTGRIRGLLHPYCNTGIAFLDNHRDRLAAIAKYLGLDNGD